MRNDLTILEQGEHLARRQELIGYKRGGDRKSSAFSKAQNEPLKTTAEIAHDIGISKQTAKNRMQVARNIVPEVNERVQKCTS